MGNNSSKVTLRLENAPVVVIIGGGYAGTTIARALDTKVNVILIERKEYFFHNIGALRASVAGASAVENVCLPYSSLLKFGYVIQGEVESIHASTKSIQVHGYDKRINYDFLVIATGTSYAFPMKVAAPSQSQVGVLFEDFSKKVSQASRILIVGGGPVGIELSGEIHDAHPDKKVILAHSAPNLIDTIAHDQFHEQLKERLQGLGIDVLLNERVVVPDDAIPEELSSKLVNQSTGSIPGLRYITGRRTLRTQSGKEISNVDMVIFATGSRVNNNAYARSGFEVNEANRLAVDDFLHVKGQSNVFAIGDCANIEGQLAFLGRLQAEHTAANILSAIDGKPLKPYKKGPIAMFVPIGQKEGAGTMNGKFFGRKLVGMAKGKELFTKDTKKKLGLTAKSDTGEKPIDYDSLASRLHISTAEARNLVASTSAIDYDRDQDHT